MSIQTIPVIVWGVSMVVAVIAGVLMYKDAKARDYIPFLWGLIFPMLGLISFGSLVFPVTLIIGIPIYLIARPKGQIKKCPYCGKGYAHYLAACPSCRREVKKECFKCHDLADLDATRCPHCGAPMPSVDIKG